MKHNILTIKEAAKFTNKSESTIRKLIAKKSILYLKHNNKIKINKEDLIFYYESIGKSIRQNISESITTDYQITETLKRTIDILQEQLEVKDEQINQLIKAQERSDILIKNFQDKVLVLEAPKSIKSTSNMPRQKQKEKKSLFGLLFGW